MGVKVEHEHQKCLEDLGEPKVEPQVWSTTDASTYWHKGRLRNVGNVSGNGELRRENAAQNTTKPKTRVWRDLLCLSPNRFPKISEFKYFNTCLSFAMCSSEVMINIKSSTHTVIISISSLLPWMYTHALLHNDWNPLVFNLLSSSQFHSQPDCFRPYIVLINQQTLLVPSPKPSGWCIKTCSFNISLR